MARMKFMNTEVDNLTMDEALDRIDGLIQENHAAYDLLEKGEQKVLNKKINQLCAQEIKNRIYA